MMVFVTNVTYRRTKVITVLCGILSPFQNSLYYLHVTYTLKAINFQYGFDTLWTFMKIRKGLKHKLIIVVK